MINPELMKYLEGNSSLREHFLDANTWLLLKAFLFRALFAIHESFIWVLAPRLDTALLAGSWQSSPPAGNTGCSPLCAECWQCIKNRWQCALSPAFPLGVSSKPSDNDISRMACMSKAIKESGTLTPAINWGYKEWKQGKLLIHANFNPISVKQIR
jgi:hypothetical protein